MGRAYRYLRHALLVWRSCRRSAARIILAASLVLATAISASGAEPLGSLRAVVTTNIVVVTNLVIVTNYVAADEPSAATSAALPAVSVPADENTFGVLWWNQGLNYRLTQRVHMGRTNEAGIPLVSERVSLTGRLGLKAALDGAAFVSAQGQQSVPTDWELRTWRFYALGDFTWKRPVDYKLELGVVGGDFYLHEAYLHFKDIPYAKNITVGYIGAPLTMENLMGFGDLTFMEAAAPAQAFGPGNRIALQFDGTWRDQRMSFQGGFYGVGQDAEINFGDASGQLARGMFRVTGLPIYEDNEDRYRLLHLGVALSHVFSDSSSIRYQARPESHLAPFLVDTGDIQAQNASQVGLELAYAHGPLSLQGELTGSRVEDASVGARTFWGGYAYASWFLTGEHRPYDRATGVFGRLKPEESIKPRRGQWGALELGVRGSYLDLSDGPVQGGRMFMFMPGLNWYLGQHLRLQGNYGWSHVLDGPSPGNLHLFQVRLQIVY